MLAVKGVKDVGREGAVALVKVFAVPCVEDVGGKGAVLCPVVL